MRRAPSTTRLDADDDEGATARARELASPAAGPEEIAEQRQLLGRALAAIEALPHGLRDAMRLRVLEDRIDRRGLRASSASAKRTCSCACTARASNCCPDRPPQIIAAGSRSSAEKRVTRRGTRTPLEPVASREPVAQRDASRCAPSRRRPGSGRRRGGTRAACSGRPSAPATSVAAIAPAAAAATTVELVRAHEADVGRRPARGRADAAVEQVHVAEELQHERRRRMVVDLVGRADLLDPAAGSSRRRGRRLPAPLPGRG